MMPRGITGALTAVLLILAGAGTALAQNYSIDARRIGMGGIGQRSNLAWDLVPSAKPYWSIPVPLGMFQTLGNLDAFNPGSSEFNPALAISYATNPLHYTTGRGGSEAGQSFMLDIVNGTLNPDLNSYSGFSPQTNISAHGLMSREVGKTLWLFDNGHTFHGVYLGAGPYLTLGTDLDFDPDLISLLAAPSGTFVPNTSYSLQNDTDLQTALSFTGGYRLKLPLPGGSATRDGLYIAANYSHLYGLHYDDVDLGIQLDTDLAGLLTGTSPVIADRLHSSSGKGRSVDVAVAVVMNRWDFTAAIEGIGNHIDWSGLGAERHSLASVTSGLDYVETPLPAPTGTLRLELPMRYSGGVSFDTGGWAAGVDVGKGLDDLEFRGGLEYRVGPVDLRGGASMIRDEWRPTTGIGLNLTRTFGIDVAMFSTTNNIERIAENSFAVSLRINRPE